MGKRTILVLTVLMVTVAIMFFAGLFEDFSTRISFMSDSNAGNVGSDIDGDGLIDNEDNCPLEKNVNQTDSDGDGVGDPCEIEEPLK